METRGIAVQKLELSPLPLQDLFHDPEQIERQGVTPFYAVASEDLRQLTMERFGRSKDRDRGAQ